MRFKNGETVMMQVRTVPAVLVNLLIELVISYIALFYISLVHKIAANIIGNADQSIEGCCLE